MLDEVREAVIAAVKRRMMSDVGIGVFLSGGLDSALVAAIAAEHARARASSCRRSRSAPGAPAT